MSTERKNTKTKQLPYRVNLEIKFQNEIRQPRKSDNEINTDENTPNKMKITGKSIDEERGKIHNRCQIIFKIEIYNIVLQYAITHQHIK